MISASADDDEEEDEFVTDSDEDEDDDEEMPQDFSRTPWLLYILAARFGVVMIGCTLRLVGVL